MTPDMLSGDEWALIRGLRDIPPGDARNELIGLVQDLLVFARDPRCPSSQADGVPCVSVETPCEDCRQVACVLASLHQRLHAA
jgi:hypothetical protein